MDSLLIFNDSPPSKTRILASERSRPASAFSTRSGSPSPDGARFNGGTYGQATKKAILGVCAMDVKARSRAMREILTRIVQLGDGAIDVKIFGDKVILDEGT